MKRNANRPDSLWVIMTGGLAGLKVDKYLAAIAVSVEVQPRFSDDNSRNSNRLGAHVISFINLRNRSASIGHGQ